ncbi:hypothetical protein RCL_jg23823.t1 [Rhizophagus clarus]|uniref:Uncharacterized protein n=1 Tax=Rhizophagus clarus TaxID=94130 RepID=A0A8H3LN70_9GLOM|nr:hypothetical protein RCL_jg23823.t1 [Rhizophagus clarus]
MVLLTFIFFILINGFSPDHWDPEFRMDFGRSIPQRSFEGVTLKLAIPRHGLMDGSPWDFYWMGVSFEVSN